MNMKDTGMNTHDFIAIGAALVGTALSVVGLVANYKGNQQRISQLNSQLDPRIGQRPPQQQ